MVKLPSINSLVVVLALFLPGAASGQGVVLWDESVNGELSQGITPPTSLTPIRLGTNSIIGATEIVPDGGNWIVYGDEFIVTVRAGLSINAIYLAVDKPNVSAWIGDPSYSTRLGWAPNASSGELLLQWGVGSLPPGTYGMYMENHDAQPFPAVANCRLDFVAQPTPEPGTACPVLLGLIILVLTKRRPDDIPRRDHGIET